MLSGLITPASNAADGSITFRNVSMVLRSSGRPAVTALDDLSVDVDGGTFCCLLGPSGCGKSTLLNLAAGFLTPTRGEIRLGGATPRTTTRRAVVFQEYALFPWLTAVANVQLGLESRGIRDNLREGALHYLSLVGLEDSANMHPHQLSGGMQQRVAIARALASEPQFLLMDEPLGALDALTREQLQRHIARLWQEFNQTVLYVTHSVSEAVYLADRIVVFTPRPGRVRKIVDIRLPRPRQPADPAFAAYVVELTEMLLGASDAT